MRFDISSWSIRNPTPVILLFVLLTFLGSMAYREMKVQNFPDIDLPTVSVLAVLPGASPAQLENDVARKIEDAVAMIQGVKHIQSNLSDGQVMIMVEFSLEKPIQQAVNDVSDAVSSIRAQLPSDIRDPIIKKLEITGAPILAYTVTSNVMDDEALSWFVDNQLSKALLGVASENGK